VAHQSIPPERVINRRSEFWIKIKNKEKREKKSPVATFTKIEGVESGKALWEAEEIDEINIKTPCILLMEVKRATFREGGEAPGVRKQPVLKRSYERDRKEKVLKAEKSYVAQWEKIGTRKNATSRSAMRLTQLFAKGEGKRGGTEKKKLGASRGERNTAITEGEEMKDLWRASRLVPSKERILSSEQKNT